MAEAREMSVTRRSVVAGPALAAAPVALRLSNRAGAQGKSLYERLGGAFAIAAVVDHFSDALNEPGDAPLHPLRPRPSPTPEKTPSCTLSCQSEYSDPVQVPSNPVVPPLPV